MSLYIDNKYEYNYQVYIFQIGFNKCGTTSLFDFMVKNKLKSIHWKILKKNKNIKWRINGSNRLLSNIMYLRFIKKNQRIIPPEFENKFKCYFDFSEYIFFDKNGWNHWQDIFFLNKNENENNVWYKILNQQYPNSKFLLNIRNVNKWIKSRYIYFGIESILNATNSKYKTEIQIFNDWKKLWYKYICKIINYFGNNKKIRNNLLIFNMDYDSIDKLINFFNKSNIYLDNKFWRHSKKTAKESDYNGQSTKYRFIKWNQEIINKYPQFNDMENEYNSLNRQCNTKNLRYYL